MILQNFKRFIKRLRIEYRKHKRMGLIAVIRLAWLKRRNNV